MKSALSGIKQAAEQLQEQDLGAAVDPAMSKASDHPALPFLTPPQPLQVFI